jgi:hypothetical protein
MNKRREKTHEEETRTQRKTVDSIDDGETVAGIQHKFRTRGETNT